MNLETNRLTDSDRETIRARVAEVAEEWGAYRRKLSTDEVGTLERIGRHSIGCADYDLRDSELSDIADIVRQETTVLACYEPRTLYTRGNN